jgi:hypothetical protein
MKVTAVQDIGWTKHWVNISKSLRSCRTHWKFIEEIFFEMKEETPASRLNRSWKKFLWKDVSPWKLRKNILIPCFIEDYLVSSSWHSFVNRQETVDEKRFLPDKSSIISCVYLFFLRVRKCLCKLQQESKKETEESWSQMLVQQLSFNRSIMSASLKPNTSYIFILQQKWKAKDSL